MTGAWTAQLQWFLLNMTNAIKKIPNMKKVIQPASQMLLLHGAINTWANLMDKIWWNFNQNAQIFWKYIW